jgi:serine/threonine protein kinase
LSLLSELMSELRRITERYLLEKQVATSETGSVFRGTDLQSGAMVAVELIRGDGESEERLQRFLETARALQALDPPILPRVLDFGITHAGSAFLVTESLDGFSLEELAGSSPGRVLALLLGLAGGLESLESQGIPSGGLRAENLLVVSAPEGEQVKILGLGSAALEPGTAPASGHAEDFHAFGLLACRLLGVQTAPTVGIPLEVAAGLQDFEALRDLLEASLRGDPGGLYPSWREVREGLRLALSGGGGRRPAARPALPPEAPSPPAPSLPDVPPPDRRGLLLGIGVPAAAVLLVVIAFGLVLLSWGRPQTLLLRPPSRKAVARPAAAPPPVALSPPPLPQDGAVPPEKREKPASRLSRALEKGDLRSLGATVAAISARRQSGRTPEARWELARARRAVAADARLWQAEKAGSPLEVIRQASALLREMPNAARASEQRERAASGIETTVDSEIVAGDFDAALYRLNGLRQVWPDRAGLAARMERVAAERTADQELESVLAAAAESERAGKPFEGRQLLAGAAPNRRYAFRFQKARERLDAQIAQLDGHPPDLALRVARPMYDRGKAATIPLRITDDFGVKDVEGWARVKGGRYVKVGVRHLSGADYALDVPADVHRNRTVEYYAVASDLSGHSSQLGSAEHPFEMKRKSWFEKHLAGGGGAESGRERTAALRQGH